MGLSATDRDGDKDLSPAEDRIPLVVDLDDTLIRTDLLHESFLRLCIDRPGAVPAALKGWRRGKAQLKSVIADKVELAVDLLPYNLDVLDYLRAQRDRGRPLYLASASDSRYVDAVATHLGLFTGIFASDGSTNLAGHNKADCLVRAFGAGGFDYIGDSRADMPVWQQARRAIVTTANPRLRRQVADRFPDVLHLERRDGRLGDYLQALRPHQWAKNGLVMLPMIAAHAFSTVNLAIIGLAFLALCLVASSVYLANDLVDLANDRDHHRKRFRPLAEGRIPIRHAVLLTPLLLLTGLTIAWLVSPLFLGVVLVYFLVTCAYSLFLKQQVIVDIMCLAGLYTIRVVAGGAALALPLSPWILAFCLFLFMALALIKRYTELKARLDAGKPAPAGRGYRLDDMPLVMALAGAAGYAAVVVLALYVNSDAVIGLYRRPEGLWAVCILLLYWISRVLLITHRGQMHDDPIVFALKDRVSLTVVGMALAVAVGSAIL